MDYEDARSKLKGRLQEYVECITPQSKGKNMYICPLCGSGTGSNRTGAFSIKEGTKWKCFSCGKGGDLFDLIGEYEGIACHAEQLRRAAEIFGVTLDGSRNAARDNLSPASQNQTKNNRYTQDGVPTMAYAKTEAEELNLDFTDFFLQAHSHIGETDYHRGLSQATLDRFKVGFVAEWKMPLEVYLKGGNGLTSTGKPRTKETWEYITPTPRLIIPISKYSYLARDTRTEIPKEQKDYAKSKVKGRDKVSWTFNAQALQTATKPIFVVEGELDAMSIIEVGGEAVGIGSIIYIKDFLELLKVKKPVQPLIVALDNETEQKKKALVEKACEDLIAGLEKLGIPYYRLNPYGEYKDANEVLQGNREALRQAVEAAEHIQDEAELAQLDEYMKNSVAGYLQSFIDGITDSVNTPYILTGFPKLDTVLDGGLYEGLYTVGAISSLGKTTFVLQIADQIAQSGHDVLIFSLEMARTELMAKSISRHTIEIALTTGKDLSNAKTARGITTGKRYTGYSQTEREVIKNSIVEYGKYAERIFISEGMGDIGVDQIRETVKQHIRFTDRTPVVVVDYLQILSPSNVRATDKQNMDKAVLELKRISRDYKTPVVTISSLNRANYSSEISMEAFKESGAIEYSSDVLIGLQLKGAGSKDFDANAAKQKNPREIELVILKNRNGSTGNRIEYRYYPLFNYFQED